MVMLPLPKPLPRILEKRDKAKETLRAWQALRKAVLKRDGHRCRLKALGGCFGSQLDVHHVVPRSLAPKAAVERKDLIALCRLHHMMLTSHRLELVMGDDKADGPVTAREA